MPASTWNLFPQQIIIVWGGVGGRGSRGTPFAVLFIKTRVIHNPRDNIHVDYAPPLLRFLSFNSNFIFKWMTVGTETYKFCLKQSTVIRKAILIGHYFGIHARLTVSHRKMPYWILDKSLATRIYNRLTMNTFRMKSAYGMYSRTR